MGIAALQSGLVVRRGGEVIGLPVIEVGDGVGGDISNIDIILIATAILPIINLIPGQVRFGIGVPGQDDLGVDRERRAAVP